MLDLKEILSTEELHEVGEGKGATRIDLSDSDTMKQNVPRGLTIYRKQDYLFVVRGDNVRVHHAISMQRLDEFTLGDQRLETLSFQLPLWQLNLRFDQWIKDYHKSTGKLKATKEMDSTIRDILSEKQILDLDKLNFPKEMK